MTFKENWIHGAKICVTALAALVPGAIYAGLIAATASIPLSFFDVKLSDHQTSLVWLAAMAVLGPFFVGDHSEMIERAAKISN